MKALTKGCTTAGVLLALLCSSAIAQAPERPDGLGQGQTRHLESVLGREVRTRPDGETGRIIDLLADRDGRLQAAVVEIGGFLGIGSRKIAVEWSAFSFDPAGPDAVLSLDLSRQQIRLAPEYKGRDRVIVVMAKDHLESF